MIVIYFFCQFIMFLGYFILLLTLQLVDEVLDMSGVDAKFSGCRSDGEFILDDGHEF